MWKNIIHDNIAYIIKLKTNPLEFAISDLKELFEELLDVNEASARFRDLNPLCESSNIIKELDTLIKQGTSQNFMIVKTEDKLTVNVESTTEEFRIKFSFNATKQSSDIFFKEITLSLINTIITLQNKEGQLCDLLEKKDKEKEEYIREFGEISRDLLKTPKFIRNKTETEEPIIIDTALVQNLIQHYGANVTKRKFSDTGGESDSRKLRKYNPKFLK